MKPKGRIRTMRHIIELETQKKTKKSSKAAQAIVLFCSFLIALSFFLSVSANAKEGISGKTITLEIDGAQVLKFDAGVSEIFVANPGIADVQLSSQHTAYVFGKSVGTTKLFAMGAKGKEVLNATVIVTHNLAHLKALIVSYDPHELVEVKSLPGGILLEGIVDNPKAAEEIRSLAEKFIGKTPNQSLINRLTVKAPTQVNLRVKIAEVSRNILNQLGINWQDVVSNAGNFKFGALVGRAPFTDTPILTNNVTSLIQPESPTQAQFVNTLGFNFGNKHVNLNAAIDALEQDGLVTILAEPNLVAVSGETASFLAGGEFPYPVPQQQNITIEFKQFGVSLAFTPTVLDGKLISMRVRPEVSELDHVNGLTYVDIAVPAVITRRAETTVQLASGQTFAIAGLLKNTVSSKIAALPGLGDLPILGTLFRSNSFQRGDTELVILVTPYLVEPVSGKEMALPTDGINYATFVEQIFERRLTKKENQKGQAPVFGPGGLRLMGPAGFSIE